MTIEEILRMRQEAGGLNKLMHMRVVTLDKDGGATVEVDLTDDLLNPLGMAHGGTIFTLCDIAAGSAAASHGRVAVTLDSTIHYYRPGRPGTKLTAVAYERKSGQKTAIYIVEVHDGEGRHIADATFTMFYTGQTLDDLKH
ncbi:MAG: PaaI family thioesterase [Agathobaculum sp.]|uniref:PaaI family thioesterase n=1 Tax=Agathobaculum sp. TaxID=2048138 RepID=UPI0025C1E84A|nr:PaaI family thioesterase [Agathobaculum sp.]MCI7125681.1 PaaI family thioesterase [Agathobaculum sp.]MDY3711140.1 PaaI family thioesterase [Agathobaculum sp.]